MSEILNHINGFLPVYRVLNREENLDFFRDVLGLKVLLEEGAMVFLGGHESKKRRLLREIKNTRLRFWWARQMKSHSFWLVI